MRGHSLLLTFALNKQNILVSSVSEDGHDWAWEMSQWPPLLNTVMEIRFPYRREIFEQLGDCQLLKRTLHHGFSYEDNK
jgi:hypothetical protein